MSTDYDDLAERAERGELTVKPGTVRRGTAARDAAQSALMDATGASTAEDAIHLALGRPPVGTKRGPSPVVRARVPQVMKDRITILAQSEQRDESDIVREAIATYLDLRHVS